MPTAFNDAHILGYQSKDWWKQALVWLAYVCAWKPFKSGMIHGYRRCTEDRRGVVAKNIFDGTTRHWYCFGSTDWGKSSLLKEGLADLMPEILAGRMSGFVMDGTELCDEILAKLQLTEEQIRKHVIFIDLAKPGGRDDIGCLPRFNLMETSDGIEEDDEYVNLTARISVFEMLFDGLLDNDTTPPMKTMLSMAAQTMAYVDHPSAHHLIKMLRAPLAFVQEIPDLDRIVREYWHDEIRVKMKNGEPEEQPNETAQALARRINGLLGSPIIKRLLVNERPTVNLAERLNRGGSLVLVATRKGKVMPAGARLVGRFMLSMLLRSVGARNSLGSTVPTFAAVDEFPNYLMAGKDDALLNLLAEARKHRCSVWLLHQEERQLNPQMLNALLTNCHVITAGGMSDAMARMVKDKLGVEVNESGPDKGKPTIELTKLKPKQFAAGVRGRKPMVIQSRKDALGDAYHRLPKGDGAARAAQRSVNTARRIMREMYATDPVQAAIDEADNVYELKEATPI